MKIKAEAIAAVVFFSVWFGGYYYCNKHSTPNPADDTIDKEINPRTVRRIDDESYKDSVYIISRHIDTVYSEKEWVEKRIWKQYVPHKK
jgi:hypothetical protein